MQGTPSVGFVEAIRLFFSNYFNFKGRTRRSEYWKAGIFVSTISTVLSAILPELGAIWALITLIPSLSMFIRRLHDIGLSGWFYLLAWVPFLSLVWCCMDSKPEENKWGMSPKYPGSPLTGNPDNYGYYPPSPQLPPEPAFQPSANTGSTVDAFQPTADAAVPLIEDCPRTTPCAPAMPAYGTLRICSGTMSGSQFDCSAGTTVMMGRSATRCQIVLDPQYHQVSGLHCSVEFQDGFVTLTDLNSTNGTYLNGTRLPANQPFTVRSGDSVYLANSACTLQFDFH